MGEPGNEEATAVEEWKKKFEDEKAKNDQLTKDLAETRQKAILASSSNKKLKAALRATKEEAREASEAEERKKNQEGQRNMIFGIGVAFLLAIVYLVMMYDTLEAGYSYGKWPAFTVFTVFILASVYFSLSYFCHFRNNLFRSCSMLIVAFLALGQFQMYLGLLAWAYPFLVEPKALMSANFAYDPVMREFNLTDVAAEMDWTYELKEVPWNTSYRDALGYEIDFILPNSEGVGFVAHFIPLVAALVYQFGVGSAGIVGLAGIVMDFVDVQDFFLLLLENDIVVSYWSKPMEDDEKMGRSLWGTKGKLGTVEVTLSNGQTHTFNSTQKRFEDWQKEGVLHWGEKFGYNAILGFEADGPYYNFNMWFYIMLFFVLASLYVALWPFFEVLIFFCLDLNDEDLIYGTVDKDDVDRIWVKRTSLMAVQAILSLTLVEIPFLGLRFACSQYYGIVMSSLFIKNIVSILIDILKITVYLFGCNLSADYVLWQEENDNRDCSYSAKKYLLRLTTIGSFIGEDFESDTKNTLALCWCCRPEHDDDEEEGDESGAFKSDRYEVLKKPWLHQEDSLSDDDEEGDDETAGLY